MLIAVAVCSACACSYDLELLFVDTPIFEGEMAPGRVLKAAVNPNGEKGCEQLCFLTGSPGIQPPGYE